MQESSASSFLCPRNLFQSETPNFRDELRTGMDAEQWIAIFFVILMVGSVVAYGAVSLI
jgi:hypothetical protein